MWQRATRLVVAGKAKRGTGQGATLNLSLPPCPTAFSEVPLPVWRVQQPLMRFETSESSQLPRAYQFGKHKAFGDISGSSHTIPHRENSEPDFGVHKAFRRIIGVVLSCGLSRV